MQYRYEGNIFSGEKRTELLVVPAFSVRVSPEVPSSPRARRVDVRRDADGRTTGRAARPDGRGGAPAAARSGRGRQAVGRGAACPRQDVARPARGAPPRRAIRAPPAGAREVRVTVVNDIKGPADSVVTLELPQGWTAAPAEQAVKFTREDESQTVRFRVSPRAERSRRASIT